MTKATRRRLKQAEQDLLRETESDELKGLSEDELVELHRRVRRARTKYTKLYRRRAAKQVKADASRGRASKAHQRTAGKAEVFEDALSRVSRRLAVAARASADELRQERLDAARAAKGGGRTRAKEAKGKREKASRAGARAATKQRRTPQRKRAAASARAATRRASAKRDAR